MYKRVNKSERKIDGLSLVTGTAKYADDFSAPDMLHLAFLRSPHAFARILSIDDSEARSLPGVVDVFCHENVDRIFFTTAGQGYPEPSPYDKCLFDSTVRYVGDEVAAVAAESKETAERACSLIKVEYETLEPVFDPKAAIRPGSPILHPEKEARAVIPVPYEPEKNLSARIHVEVGDFSGAFEESSGKIDWTFSMQQSSHCAMEPHAALAYFDERGRVVVVSSTQVPFHARRIVSKLTGIPIRNLRVIKPRIGGGFGGKQEVILEPYVALAAWRTKRPCKHVFSRKDVFVSGRTRHAQEITIRAGFDPSTGKIRALGMEAIENAGAYGPHSLTVLSNTASKVLPILNKIDNLKFDGYGVYTNLPVAGAYRGYGATQGYFAYSQVIDEVIRRSGTDPVDYYLKWCIKSGEGSPIFKEIGEGTEGVEMVLESVGLSRCIETGAEKFRWKAKRKEYSERFAKDARFKRGVGMACFMQGSAIPKVDMASCYMKMNDDGSFNLHVGATDIGTGSDTVLAQIAAEVLDVPAKEMIVHSSDTDFTPFDTGAYASSTTYLSGGAVKKCAEALKESILKTGAELLDVPLIDVFIQDGKVVSRGTGASKSFSEICTYSYYSQNQYQIQAHASYVADRSPPPFAAHFAEIEIDSETGRISVIDYLTVTDCGTPINPALAEGQVEGALVNGLSYALREHYQYGENGVLLNGRFGKYRLFSARDIPNITTIILDGQEEASGPFGAKSIAEIAINGPLPVIGNAFAHATGGKRLFRQPYSPEYVLGVLNEE